MDKETLYNGLVESKKSSAKQTKLYVYGCVAIVAMVLVFAFMIFSSTMDKLVVIDQKGNEVQSHITTREKVLETTVTKFCSETTYLGNTFDRITLKENQAKLKFIMEEKSALRLWGFFKQNKHYNDALYRGYAYKGKFIKMLKMDLSQKPYAVQFLGELEVYEGANLSRKIPFVAKGKITERSAKYPESYLGWYMTDYLQNFKAND
ncbi:hypothetical protein [Tenacibaculum agarivorans]|uniref:hypothetical protein n=1 Tax=Tenacibaculum agarivorans TaxID=1908389 RepID=UPI00094B8341|nr:hypothetical protein [Tenacibaculum agarivorans]